MKNYIYLPPHVVIAFVYLLLIVVPVCLTIQHTDEEVKHLRKAYDTDNLQNNGAIKEAALWREIEHKHNILGPLAKDFFSPSINKQLKLPTEPEARFILSEIPYRHHVEKEERNIAYCWALILLLISAIYLGLTVTQPPQQGSNHVFALTIISLVFLTIGILADAMILVVSPVTTVFPPFILHYEVRSIFGVIEELYSSSYWVVAICLTLFSILIPLTKAILTLLVLEVRDLPNKLKIAKFLHEISKWSMADVFVAAMLLSNFAVRANPSTRAHLYLGFYFFMSYCLLSMLTTTLLEHQMQSADKNKDAE